MSKPPFTTSFSFRAYVAGATVSLVGGGLAPLLGISPTFATPVLVLLAVAAMFSGFFAGALDYPGETLACIAVGVPLSYGVVMGMIFAGAVPTLGWALVAAGIVPLVVGVGYTRAARTSVPAPAPLAAANTSG